MAHLSRREGKSRNLDKWFLHIGRTEHTNLRTRSVHSHSVFPLGSQLSQALVPGAPRPGALVVPEHAGAARRRAVYSANTHGIGIHTSYAKAAHSASTTAATKAEGSRSPSE